ncbi:metal ABC transporter ATP-binding protein [Corynebacterium tapiri]|uniref:Metal ABC transporter ATP-binding protein n=1 Tax=Corynebacterium tapiri TaxID=1448266 RepID=A0A5C4U432_9CORY|nr:metal ABC transporter ATP-binding protein [Corynebacterium tapiri]TNL98483.1 metal ABC transporter ATP-binding protein [Corynebacterium tapiri]
MSQAALTLDGLRVVYREVTALDVDKLQIAAGSITGLVGPNGSGKSTLLKASLGLVPALGHAHFSDARLGYLPQRSALDLSFPITVGEVALMGTYRDAGLFRRLKPAHRERAQRALERTQTADLRSRHISELSGGQLQRVLLARTLAQEPEVVLLDEPFAGVDTHSEALITDVLRELNRAGATIIIVHHDLSAVAKLCDDVVVLSSGRVVAQGPPSTALGTDVLRRAFGLETAP